MVQRLQPMLLPMGKRYAPVKKVALVPAFSLIKMPGGDGTLSVKLKSMVMEFMI